MIIEKLFSFFGDIFMGLIGLFNIPGVPNDVLESAKDFLELLFSNASLLGLFIRINTIKVTALLLIIIINFQHIYNLGRFLLNKMPFFKST